MWLKLIQSDFKCKPLFQIGELQDKLCPLKNLIERQGIEGKAADYVHTKFTLLMKWETWQDKAD